jgi:1,2-diacylglycerol 3-beta-galactosyltransferase
MKYKPDVIISVHPLMQHIPLWVLKWQSLQAKIPFFTVITDLNTCHPTW